MEFAGIGSVAAVTVICLLVGYGIKATPLDNKWIPLLVGVSGAILGVIGWKVMPDYPAQDVLTAVAVGIVSGLSSTGVNQIYKQLQDGGHDA